jgi:hypothetical protein
MTAGSFVFDCRRIEFSVDLRGRTTKRIQKVNESSGSSSSFVTRALAFKNTKERLSAGQFTHGGNINDS